MADFNDEKNKLYFIFDQEVKDYKELQNKQIKLGDEYCILNDILNILDGSDQDLDENIGGLEMLINIINSDNPKIGEIHTKKIHYMNSAFKNFDFMDDYYANAVEMFDELFDYYTKLKLFYENKNSQFKAINYDDFIFSLKEEFLNNLIRYKNQLDIINYPSFYYELNLFINEECNYCNYNKQNQISKFQTMKNSNNSTYRQNIPVKNDRKENKTARLIKGNNSYDEYRKYKNEKKDKSPRINKKTTKKSTLIMRQKTPSKSNKYYDELSFNKNNTNNNNNKYLNKTLYKNQKTNSVIEDEKNNNIFGDVGNIVNYNKRFSYKK